MFKFRCVVIFLFILREIEPKISDKRLCANENCTKPISHAKTILKYASGDHGVLSFDQNVEVIIYSKSAGSNVDLWGVEINGIRGYAPKGFLRETRVLTKELPYLVDTERTHQQVPSNESESDKTIKANKVPEFTVIDGTTIYSDPIEEISPTPRTDDVLPTETVQNLTIEDNPVDTINEQDVNNKQTEPLQIVKSNNEIDEEIEGDKSSEINSKAIESEKKESITEQIVQTIVDWIGDEKKEKEDVEVNKEEDYEYSEEDDQDIEDDEDEDEDFDELEEESDSLGDVDSNEDEINEKAAEISSEISEDSAESDKVPVEKEKSDVGNKISEMESVAEESVKLRQLLSENEGSDDVVMKNVIKMQEDSKIENMKLETSTNLPKSPEMEEKIESTIDTFQKEAPDSKKSVEKDQLQLESKEETPKETKTLENKEIPPETVTESSFIESIEIEPPNLQDFQDYVTSNPLEDIASILTPEVKPEISEESSPLGTSSNDNDSGPPIPKDDVSEVNTTESVKSTERASAESPLDDQEDKSSEVIVDKAAEIEKIGTNDNQTLKKPDEDVREPEEIETNVSDEGKAEIPPEDTPKDEKTEMQDTNDFEVLIEESQTLTNFEKIPEEKPAENVQNLIDSEATHEEIDKTAQDAHNLIDKEKSIEDSEKNDQAKIQNPEKPEILDSKPSENQSSSDDHFPQPEIEEEHAENISGVLSGFKNWLGSTPENMDEAPTKTSSELNDEVNNENVDSKKNVEEKTDENVETYTVDLGNPEQIEKHDHGFLSVLGEKEKVPSEEEYQPTEAVEAPFIETIFEQLENQYISSEEPAKNVIETQDDITEAPVTEEVIPVDPSEEWPTDDNLGNVESHIFDANNLLSKNSVEYGSCPAGESDCPTSISVVQKQLEMEEIANATFYDFINLLTLLGVTGFSVALFLLGFITIDKNRKEGSLIAKINTLEKALLVASKENSLLSDRVTEIINENDAENNRISSEEYETLNTIHQETLSAKNALEEQIQTLEKELENSTEVGLELNRMLSDILSSQNGSETLIANVEQLQRQLIEQQGTINAINDTLNLKDTENHELQLELEIKNKKVTHLQAELDKMAMNLFKVEEDKEQMQAKLEGEIIELKDQLEKSKNSFNSARTKLLEEINTLKGKYGEIQRSVEVKINEYNILKDNFNQIKSIKNNSEALQSLLNASAVKAELQQLQRDNQALNDLLRQAQQAKFTLEKQMEIALHEAQGYKVKYDDSDKEKLEAQTKLEVLSNYFKEREAQLQKELSKHESMWIEKQGEATSTVERIKYMQEELQNYKSQNELLKQEIVSQEVELKSQISVLEKKAHESWVSARQAERRLEDAKQEAAQLRNRLTLKERSLIEEKNQNRMQSPLEQNGDVAISPLHMPVETPASPPLLYGARDHLTTSPPLPNLPPFLPPPPGVPFMPPPIPGVPGFMPPPPSMFPVDHRPPPLGRMSSPPPPMNSRYSPDSRYSPYDRNSPSPPYDDEYGSSPPPMPRGYSPYNNRDDRRDFKRPPPPLRANGRNKGAMSSGSGNSNESLEKISRHHSKV